MSGRDQVYRDPQHQIVDFVFDDTVVDVFPDMIRRSVPGYEVVIPMTGLMAARHLKSTPGIRPIAYDLGCSLGATSLAVLRQMGDLPCTVHAVDNAPAMIERGRALIDDARLRWHLGDVRDVALDDAGVVLLNYVLQFVPPDDRLTLLRRIRLALGERGLLIVSEKIRFEDSEVQTRFDAAHLDFKRANGYSELEIAQKRSALENVMRIDSEATHRERFAAAGFGTVVRWYQCLNWASFLVSA
ncbi:MAG: carboxy-S-adenosyl-L-methionine synthase CmoA [Pseudomonadales bacterium]